MWASIVGVRADRPERTGRRARRKEYTEEPRPGLPAPGHPAAAPSLPQSTLPAEPHCFHSLPPAQVTLLGVLHVLNIRVHSREAGRCMQRFIVFVFLSVGGWLGWALGTPVSFFTAFMLSIVGTGLGLYVGKRVAKYLVP